MAQPIGFEEANVTLGPPGGMEADVVPLPVRHSVDGQLVSCWQLSADEIEEIVRTRKVWISVWGGMSQPPVFVMGHKHEAIGPQP
jgi:hypothetical protein